MVVLLWVVLLAAIAQLGERQTEDLKVPGSIPGGGISFFFFLLQQASRESSTARMVFALVAQLVEHGSNKPRVGGSSPSWSTCTVL